MQKIYTLHNTIKIFFLTSLIVSFVFSPLSTFAAQMSFSPTNISVYPGQTFSVTMIVHPQEKTAYTVRASLSFNSEMLEMTNFSFAGQNWMPLFQAGYNREDNTSGSVIKTAGFGGGFSSSQTFGTATFRVKTEGNTEISTTGDVLIYNAENTNIHNGVTSKVSVTSKIAPAPPQEVSAQQTPPALVPMPTYEEDKAVAETDFSEESNMEEEYNIEDGEVDARDTAAAVLATDDFEIPPMVLYIIILILLILLGVVGFGRFTRQ